MTSNNNLVDTIQLPDASGEPPDCIAPTLPALKSWMLKLGSKLAMDFHKITQSAPPSRGTDEDLLDRCLNAILEMNLTSAERRLLSFLVGREDNTNHAENHALGRALEASDAA